MDPITKAYMSILEEKCDSSGIVKSTTSQVGKTFGDSESDSKVKNTFPSTSDENIDLEDVEESDRELNSDGADGKSKVMKKESKTLNPFDALYNRVLREEGEFNFSTENENELEPSMEGSEENDPFGDDPFGDSEDESMEDSETVEISLDKELAKKLHDVLMAAIGDDAEAEEEVEDIEDMGDESETEEGEDSEEEEQSENPFKESVEAEECGHALVDQEKLERGMTSKSNKEVKGAVPVSKKSAEVPSSGKDSDGQLKPHSTEGAVSKLTGKSNNVGGVTVGKSLFDQ
jgi:hypothetical protein